MTFCSRFRNLFAMETHLRTPQELFAKPVQYKIPDFQRRYVWRHEEQWEPLWDDVEQLADSILNNDPAESHFMGAIVFKHGIFPTGTIECRIVVDGQQRLTTLQLLMDAVQETLENQGHSDQAKRLGALVQNPEEYRYGEQDNAFKVWPTIVDRDAFRHAMSNDLSAVSYEKFRIVQAHDYFRGQAAQWLDRFPSEAKKRDKAASVLEEVVRTKLQLVVIDLGNMDDPHVIFETLNARGTPLLQSDMIKNKILHDAGVGVNEDDGEASAKKGRLWPFLQDKGNWWAQDVGRGLQRRPRVDVYLNHWLTLRNRKETKPYNEFNAFTKYAKEQCEMEENTIEKIATDMGDLGKIYRHVEEKGRTDIAEFLERRNVMKVGVITPLLLWLLSEDLPPVTLSNCIKALESFLVRRVVCGYSARSYGEFFVGLIAKLAKGSTDQADSIVVSYLTDHTAQTTLWPTDDHLREKLINAPLYQYLQTGRLKMVLSGIEKALHTKKTESREMPKNLQIEHIMPRAWQDNWPLSNSDNESIERRERVIHSIGNLTLVSGPLNASLSNAPWESKKQTLAEHSVMFLNKHIVNHGPPVWDEDAIEERAKWLCDKAVKVWPHGSDIET